MHIKPGIHMHWTVLNRFYPRVQLRSSRLWTKHSWQRWLKERTSHLDWDEVGLGYAQVTLRKAQFCGKCIWNHMDIYIYIKIYIYICTYMYRWYMEAGTQALSGSVIFKPPIQGVGHQASKQKGLWQSPHLRQEGRSGGDNHATGPFWVHEAAALAVHRPTCMILARSSASSGDGKSHSAQSVRLDAARGQSWIKCWSVSTHWQWEQQVPSVTSNPKTRNAGALRRRDKYQHRAYCHSRFVQWTAARMFCAACSCAASSCKAGSKLSVRQVPSIRERAGRTILLIHCRILILGGIEPGRETEKLRKSSTARTSIRFNRAAASSSQVAPGTFVAPRAISWIELTMGRDSKRALVDKIRANTLELSLNSIPRTQSNRLYPPTPNEIPSRPRMHFRAL